MEINLGIEQTADIVVDDNITVHIYRSPQGYVIDTYSVQDGSHISTETIWEDEYCAGGEEQDETDEMDETKHAIMNALVEYFNVADSSITEDNFKKFCDELIPALTKSINEVNMLDVMGCFNPHCYGFKHWYQSISSKAIIHDLESFPLAINTTSLSDKDIQEIAEECSKVFESYDTLDEWQEDACDEWWKVLEEEALKHGCTYYEDEEWW